MNHEQETEILRIKEKIQYIRENLLFCKMWHIPSHPKSGNCKNCGIEIHTLNYNEICEDGTRETRKRAQENIEGGELLCDLVMGVRDKEAREKILSFLNQSLP